MAGKPRPLRAGPGGDSRGQVRGRRRDSGWDRRGDGWSDGPRDPRYNRPVPLPHAFGHERLWRADELYDLILVLGYNDDPPVAGRGSAIFLHRARDDYSPTEGCVALGLEDLLHLVADLAARTFVRIREV
jgi:L,D-peptidoglycan transpeptidase YkuD (ErfK/YbiS/YcfS/YnhG family)